MILLLCLLPLASWFMAIRHEVQNLQRRGNIFYWRDRIPVRMRISIDVQHLAFSLKQSDHHRAGYMARKLNLLLHEISLKPESTMINKEALEKLFQSEIMRMNEHMKNLRLAGQRSADGFQNLDNMTADMEVGWAYRLLEKFGTRQALFQHPDCIGHSYLKQSAVPQELHTNIITTYVGEKHAAETPVFRAEIEALMQEHGISAGILNVEKAKAEYFRALISGADLMEECALATADVAGWEKVAMRDEPVMGSEDFADMLRIKRGGYLYLGYGGTTPVHNFGFILDDNIIPFGANIFSRLVERWLA